MSTISFHAAKPIAISSGSRRISQHELQRISRATELKYAEFTKNAIQLFGDDSIARLAQALSKIALLHDLAQHLSTDAATAFEMLDAVSELSDETQRFLSGFLRERGFPALHIDEVSTFVRQEGR